MSIDKIIEEIIEREGGYVNNSNDSGAATRFGITEKVARENGYKGSMRWLSKDMARDIYMRRYVTDHGFDAVYEISPAIAEELVDTSVNMGNLQAILFLQRSLNALNRNEKFYADVNVDGNLGPLTLSALKNFLGSRAKDGEKVLLRAMNCLQGERYIALAERSPKNEEFCFGWLLNRVM